MPFSSAPYTPVAGQSETVNNPAQAQGGGKTTSAAAVIANNSPFVLNVGSGEGAGTATVYPFTRDIVALDAEAGQQLVITAIDIGVVAPSTVMAIVYVTWFQAQEETPTNLPISLGNTSTTTSTQQVLLGSAVTPNIPGTEIVIPTNPLWRSIWVLLVGNAMVGPPVCQGASGAFYFASTPPYLIDIPGEQLFYRFNIIPAAEDEVTLSLPTAGVVLAYWGADLADTDVLTYDQSGGLSGMANTPTPHDFSYDAALVAGSFPGFFVSTPPGSQSFLTRLWGQVLAGTSVDVTIRVNSYPAYAGPVDVVGFNPITVVAAPGGFVLPVPLEVFDLDYVDVDLSNLVASPGMMALLVDELVVPS